jgi:hypothetical protein
MAYPSSLDSFSTKIDGVDYPKASHINSLQTAVEALEAKVGIEDSDVSTSLDYIIKNDIWPIGSVFISVVSTDPSILLGFGTWSQIAGGKVLIGQTDADSDFNVAEETGGAKTANLAHTHTGPSHTHTGPSHTHTFSDTSSAPSATTTRDTDSGSWAAPSTGHTHNVSGTTGAGGTGNTGAGGTGNTGSGGSATQSIMNPYYTCYFWKRVS